MHQNNPHKTGYDFVSLSEKYPPLKSFFTTSTKGKLSIDFANSNAVKALNTALLIVYYNMKHWDIPEGFLCPAVPGRADYVHHLKDLLDSKQIHKTESRAPRVLDIGTGANLIYPIIGSQTFGWKFVASDVSSVSINSATAILQSNSCLKNKVTIRHQRDSKRVFSGIIKPKEYFDLSMCNPPFHSSEFEAQRGNTRKLKGLQANQNKRRGKTAKFQPIKTDAKLNFGGQHNELWCDGGEYAFISNMIEESKEFADQVGWFTCLVSKSSNLKGLKQKLSSAGAKHSETYEMNQGNKTSRFIAWNF